MISLQSVKAYNVVFCEEGFLGFSEICVPLIQTSKLTQCDSPKVGELLNMDNHETLAKIRRGFFFFGLGFISNRLDSYYKAFFIIPSTTSGFNSVLVSPKFEMSLEAIFLKILRIIFPLRVFGNPITN